MPVVAHAHPFVIGVDTLARTHTLAVLVAGTGELITTEQFPATGAGINRAITWSARRTNSDPAALWVIGGIGTYGAHLAAAAKQAGYEVIEAARMDARAHRGTGESDPLAARRIAAAVLPLKPEQLRRPRSDNGTRAALRPPRSWSESSARSLTRTTPVRAMAGRGMLDEPVNGPASSSMATSSRLPTAEARAAFGRQPTGRSLLGSVPRIVRGDHG